MDVNGDSQKGRGSKREGCFLTGTGTLFFATKVVLQKNQAYMFLALSICIALICFAVYMNGYVPVLTICSKGRTSLADSMGRSFVGRLLCIKVQHRAPAALSLAMIWLFQP